MILPPGQTITVIKQTSRSADLIHPKRWYIMADVNGALTNQTIVNNQSQSSSFILVKTFIRNPFLLVNLYHVSTDRIMNCVRCGNDAGYNRLVAELYSGAEIGGLCMNCEKEQYGECLSYVARNEPRQCAFCERDGHFALPRWVPSLEKTDDKVVSTVSLEETDTAVKLCDEHAQPTVNEPTTDKQLATR